MDANRLAKPKYKRGGNASLVQPCKRLAKMTSWHAANLCNLLSIGDDSAMDFSSA